MAEQSGKALRLPCSSAGLMITAAKTQVTPRYSGWARQCTQVESKSLSLYTNSISICVACILPWPKAWVFMAMTMRVLSTPCCRMGRRGTTIIRRCQMNSQDIQAGDANKLNWTTQAQTKKRMPAHKECLLTWSSSWGCTCSPLSCIKGKVIKHQCIRAGTWCFNHLIPWCTSSAKKTCTPCMFWGHGVHVFGSKGLGVHGEALRQPCSSTGSQGSTMMHKPVNNA